MLIGYGEHVMEANVLPSPNVPNKGLTVDAYGKGDDDASVRDVLEFILALCKALYVITETLTDLAFASQEVPRGAWLSVSPLKVII